MKRKILFSILAIVIIITGVTVHQLLWGKLFPYSPAHPGFTKHELSNSIVYIQEGAYFNNYDQIDSLILPVEEFHELKFLHKPAFFIFRDTKSFLQRSTSKARFCTFYNGDIVIAPWALEESKKGIISLEIYLRHELSHSILYQNKGLLNSYKYPKWLLEGIAMYSAGQMGTSFYPGKEETYSLIKEGNFYPPEYFESGEEDEIKIKVENKQAFIYSEFACLVEYLVGKYGRAAFIKYMHTLLNANDNNLIFKSVFSKGFDEVVKEFKKAVLQS